MLYTLQGDTMAQNNVDPERVIESLGRQIAQLTVQNTMLSIALEDANRRAADAVAAAAEGPGPDGA